MPIVEAGRKNRLRRRREQIGLSRGDLARQAHCSPNLISAFESAPNLELAARLSAVLGCEPGDLFEQFEGVSDAE